MGDYTPQPLEPKPIEDESDYFEVVCYINGEPVTQFVKKQHGTLDMKTLIFTPSD